jgi:hypothetical protein
MAELMATPEFCALTEKQKGFCARYCSVGIQTGRYSATEAAAVTYATKHPQNLGAGLLRQRKIRKVLDIHFRTSPLDAILINLETCARRSAKLGMGLSSKCKRALLAFHAHVREHQL